MAAVVELSDPFARVGLQVLRGTGLRVGELLDLELGAVVDYGPAGTWLRVPLGKLATERTVPLDEPTLAALDEWAHRRGGHRPIPHPRTGRPTDFLFTEHGRRLGATRLRNGLLAAVAAAGLTDLTGRPLRVTPHQLRHTYAATLANAGMSLQALMALLGHVTPEMTIRYATLASPTLRGAYDEAMGKMRRQLTLTPVGRPIVPDKVSWLASEMLKTRVAHGYCSRHESQGPCPYANICETCDNYTTAAEFQPALTDQLADVRALQADAEQRGWTGEEELAGPGAGRWDRGSVLGQVLLHGAPVDLALAADLGIGSACSMQGTETTDVHPGLRIKDHEQRHPSGSSTWRWTNRRVTPAQGEEGLNSPRPTYTSGRTENDT